MSAEHERKMKNYSLGESDAQNSIYVQQISSVHLAKTPCLRVLLCEVWELVAISGDIKKTRRKQLKHRDEVAREFGGSEKCRRCCFGPKSASTLWWTLHCIIPQMSRLVFLRAVYTLPPNADFSAGTLSLNVPSNFRVLVAP